MSTIRKIAKKMGFKKPPLYTPKKGVVKKNEVAIVKGVKIRIDASYMSERMIKVLREKRYEVEESKHIDGIIQKGEIILEIGSGLGFVTTLMARNSLVKRIVTYEANPDLIAKTQFTLQQNLGVGMNNVELRNAVLMNGKRPKRMKFYVHKDFWASSLMPIKDAVATHDIKVENFNKVLKELQPTMIVCDIEGGELELFEDANLDGVKKIYLEVHQRKYGRENMIKVFEHFHKRNYHYDQHHSSGSVVLFSQVDR